MTGLQEQHATNGQTMFCSYHVHAITIMQSKCYQLRLTTIKALNHLI